MQSLTTYAKHSATAYPRTLAIADIALPRGVTAPACGLVCLFGKTALPELSRQRRAAESGRKTLTAIQIVVDADDTAREFATLSHLRTAEFLSLSNMSGEAIACIMDRMAARARAARIRLANPMESGVFTTRQLNLLAAVVADPYFERLQVVTTRIPELAAPLGWIMVALLCSAEKITGIQARRYASADILLPNKLALTRAAFEAAWSATRRAAGSI